MPNPLMPNPDSSNPLMPVPDQTIQEPPSTDKVMYAPDNKLYKVPLSSLQDAKNKGWKEALPSEIESGNVDIKERAIQQGVEDLEAKGEEARFNDTLTNEVLFGIPGIVEDSKLTPEEREIKTEVQHRITQAHPIEQYGAKLLGAAIPAFMPGIGEAGEAVEGAIRGGRLGEAGIKAMAEATVKQEAEVSLVRKIAGTAANYATQGAIYSAPTALAQAAYGDPEQAMETMGWGIGLSAVLGGGIELGTQAVKGIGRTAVRFTDAIGSKLFTRDAAGVTPADAILKNLYGLSDKQAQILKDTGQLDDVLNTSIEEGLHEKAGQPGYEEAVNAVKKDSGKKLGDLEEKLEKSIKDNPSQQLDTFKISQEAQDILLTKHPEINNPLHAESLKFATQLEDGLLQLGKNPTIGELKQYQQDIRKLLNDYDSKTVKGQIIRLYDNVIKKNIEETAANVFNQAKIPEAFPEYLQQKRRYQTAMTLSEGIPYDFKGKGKLTSLKDLFNLPNMGAVALALYGHPVAAGAELAGKYAVKQFLSNKYGLLGKSAAYLRNAEDPLIGSYLAKAGQEALQAHMDKLPHILNGSTVITRATSDYIQHLIGPTTGMSHHQQYSKLDKSIAQANANPQITAQRLGQVAAAFPPELQHIYVQKQLNTLAYLDSQRPKNPNPPPAFTKDAWQPTLADKHQFMRKVEIVSNPMTVWKHFQQNTMDATDREVMMVNYPKIYQRMIGELAKMAADPKIHLKDYQIQQIAMFTGLPLDPNMNNIAAIQQAIAVPPAAPPQMTPGKRGKSNRLTRNDLPSLATPVQQQTYKETV